MLNLTQTLADDLNLKTSQVQRTLELFDEGATVPFVARYRKEQTGGLDETMLRSLRDRYQYLQDLQDRKAVILNAIEEQGVLTDALRTQIEACLNKAELEDLYLPYKPKRRTRATDARARGLEPLADWIASHNITSSPPINLEAEARRYITDDVPTPDDALQGASDILAESVAEKSTYRAYVRTYISEYGAFMAEVKSEHPKGTTQFEMYRNYRRAVRDTPAHNVLALGRGEDTGILKVNIDFDEDAVLTYLEGQVIQTRQRNLRAFLRTMIHDAFKRLMKSTLTNDVRRACKEAADEESIQTFAGNLRDLLLTPPAGPKRILAVDPGFRTGCKMVTLDATGKLLKYQTIYPHSGEARRTEAATAVRQTLKSNRIELIAIGNGTAGRETKAFLSEVTAELDDRPQIVMVNESGASVYSASPTAIEEFPDLDVTIRGAVSIGRRLQDPLAELVKIEPKSIGVGQYQHDVDQTLLRQKLEETVESCVNYVGVDLNTASAPLLQFVSGLTPSVAKNIVSYRDTHGAFRERQALLDVPRFGPRAFEQAAGFLRIRSGSNPLDNTAVHPERYGIVKQMARDLGVPISGITAVPEQVKSLDLKRYMTAEVGLPTLVDIQDELQKPGRDPRSTFTYARFKEDVNTPSDLEIGMKLEGVVTNVTNFGAFVDIGVHQDGLVHISQLANRFVKDPKEIVHVGQVVQVKVVSVDLKLNRIGLSMRTEEPARQPRKKRSTRSKSNKPNKPDKPNYTVDDLKRKFNRR